MTPKPRQMRLTPELVARVARHVDDPGPTPGLGYYSESDYDGAVREILAAENVDGDVWIFAYGSLIWNPACEFVEQRIGLAHGWHRSFCLQLKRFRGTPEQPGLMMALDRGGACRGVVYRLPPDAVTANLGKLFRREITVKPASNVPRWVSIGTDAGPLRAIAFVIERKSDRYVSGLSPEAVADTLSVAVGHWGSGADYLHNTVKHLDELGLHDAYLWRLQELVADRIKVATATP